MGGGDLNSKKSWHPNTMKNQERVWKAEQAAAEEQKRMLELQRERTEERDRAELNDIMNKHSTSSAGDSRLAWMYDKPDKRVEQEAYLLGKAVDKSCAQTEHAEPESIPAVSRRVVGSSMLTAAGDTQVDMSRKIREDPLLLIKERERAARAALLNNPLQRRKLTELLRKEQDQRKETKAKNKPKKKDKKLDDLLAEKLNALGGQKSIDLATLLDSDDSSSDSEHERSKKKKKRDKKKSKKKKKRKHSTESDGSTDKNTHTSTSPKEEHTSGKKYLLYRSNNIHEDSRKRRSSEGPRRSESPVATKYHKRDHSSTKRNDYESSSSRSNRYYDEKESSTKYGSHRKSPSAERDRRKKDLDGKDNKRRGGLSEQEKAARLAEMAAAGAAREIERGRRVLADAAHVGDVGDVGGVGSLGRGGRRGPAVPHARALPDSLESRIRSTRHYIQRDKRHMNEHFARR